MPFLPTVVLRQQQQLREQPQQQQRHHAEGALAVETQPEPWRNSKAKQYIINCLKDPLLPIMKKKKTKNNLTRLLKQHTNNEGPFCEQTKSGKGATPTSKGISDKAVVEPWTSRKQKGAKAGGFSTSCGYFPRKQVF